LFLSGSYTQFQIDSAIAYFGYFVYNTAITVPNVTNAAWSTYDMAWVLENVSTYNETLTDIDDADTFSWSRLETDYSYGAERSEKTYLYQLYQDGLNETPRWEWYSDKGITSTNYAAYLSAYNTLLTNYSTGIAFATFDGLTVSYDREDVEPYVPPTLLEGIEDYIDNFGLGQWAYIFISIAIMIVFAVLLGLMHAPMMVMLIVEAALFLLFTIFGWFPVWLVILVVIVLFALLYNLLKGDGQSA